MRIKNFLLIMIFLNPIFNLCWGKGSAVQNSDINFVSRLHLESTTKIIIEPINLNKRSDTVVIDDVKEIQLILHELENIKEKTLIDTWCNYKVIFYKIDNTRISELELNYDFNYPHVCFLRNRNVQPYEDYYLKGKLPDILNAKLKNNQTGPNAKPIF